MQGDSNPQVVYSQAAHLSFGPRHGINYTNTVCIKPGLALVRGLQMSCGFGEILGCITKPMLWARGKVSSLSRVQISRTAQIDSH